MRALFLVFVFAICRPTTTGAQDAALDDPAGLTRALTEAVDAARPKERSAAARQLSKRSEVTIDDWLAAMRAFPSRGEPTPGRRIETVELWVDGTFETTELVLYVPTSYDRRRPAPLMVAFHGTGGEGRHVVRTWESLADDLGMLVLAPSEAGPNAGFAATQRERDAALAALRWMRREFNVDENQVFASGFSRGGHVTWDLALRYPDHFAAIAPMVGGPRWEPARGAANLRYLENIKHVPIRDLQGAKDQEGLVWNVRLAFRKLGAMGARDAVLHEFPDLGHDVNMNAVQWHGFLASSRRDPARATVVRRFARKGEGRAGWVEVLQAKKGVVEVFQPRIKASKFDALTLEDKRMLFVDSGDEHTATLTVKRLAPGEFTAKTDGVARFRLLLTPEMIGPKGGVVVKVDGKRRSKRPAVSKKVLLEEFVERFDRTFLPVAEVVLKR